MSAERDRIIIEVRDVGGAVLFVGSPVGGDTLRIERTYKQAARLVCDVSELIAASSGVQQEGAET